VLSYSCLPADRDQTCQSPFRASLVSTPLVRSSRRFKITRPQNQTSGQLNLTIQQIGRLVCPKCPRRLRDRCPRPGHAPFQQPSEDGVGGTTEQQFHDKIAKWESLPQPQSTNRLLAKLHTLHEQEILNFKQRLEAAIKRRVNSVRLTVLRGHSVECSDVKSAIIYLVEEEKSYRMREDGEQRESYEIQVRFNTGAKIDATFPKRAEAIAFLRSFT
jgi:hypothetical protein